MGTPAGSDGAAIVLTRKRRAWRDGARGYQVMLDGEQVAMIKRGQTLELPVAPGRHEILLKVSWCHSPVVEVDARPGEVIHMFCQPGGPAGTALFDTVANTRGYISLTRSDADTPG